MDNPLTLNFHILTINPFVVVILIAEPIVLQIYQINQMIPRTRHYSRGAIPNKIRQQEEGLKDNHVVNYVTGFPEMALNALKIPKSP